MKLFSALQQRFGFTSNEIKVVLFLSITFLAGLGVRWYHEALPRSPGVRFDYSRVDSEFAARSQAVASFGVLPSPAAPHQKPALQERSVNVNTASAKELVGLPGIGPAYAERIVEYRKAHGPFTSVDQLARVKGIGKKKLEKLKPFVTL